MPLELTANQNNAVTLSTKSKRLIVTGGAGSGKTTVIRSIIEKNWDKQVCLCAPTGKAAARVREATAHDASTVHSACGLFPGEAGEYQSTQNKVPPIALADLVIIDEASMLDSALLAAVVRKMNPAATLILVGDPYQLPPVGSGYPFRDLVNSKKVSHVHLEVCHRQTGKLLENCYSILDGGSPDVFVDAGKAEYKSVDWSFIPVGDDGIQTVVARLFEKDVAETVFDVKIENSIVLTPLNRGPYGRIALNRVAQRSYHTSRGRVAPVYESEEKGFDKFIPGDRVIWTKNNKDVGLVNGDVGTVLSVGDRDIRIAFDGIGDKTVTVSGSPLQLAFVLTCHKAQGSQYDKAFVVVAGAHVNKFLEGIVNRSWAYTAFTRSKRGSFAIGSTSALAKIIEKPNVDKRVTVISVKSAS